MKDDRYARFLQSVRHWDVEMFVQQRGCSRVF